MPRRAKGARLWLRPVRRDSAGAITHIATWIILDGPVQRSTGLGIDATTDQKEKALNAYLTEKLTDVRQAGLKDPTNIKVDEVLTLYVSEKVATHSDPDKTKSRIRFLKAFWAGKMLSDVNGVSCRAYARSRPEQAARRELEDFRAAIIYHRREGLHDRIVSVVLPEKAPRRERFLTRDEAAHLIWTTWWHQSDHGNGARHYSRRHIARFMVVARYMGSRASVIAAASIEPKRPPTGPWIDLETGMFYGAGVGERETNKRKQKTPVPFELLGHLRRWRKNGQRFAVQRGKKPVQSVKKGHSEAVAAAGLEGVTQHTWRHTVATWLLSEDVNVKKVADFLAVDSRTLERVYGHVIPDRTAEVHAAFRAHRTRTIGGRLGKGKPAVR